MYNDESADLITDPFPHFCTVGGTWKSRTDQAKALWRLLALTDEEVSLGWASYQEGSDAGRGPFSSG